MCTLGLLLLIPLALKWPMKGERQEPVYVSCPWVYTGHVLPTHSRYKVRQSGRTSPRLLLGKASHKVQTTATDFRRQKTASIFSSQRKLQPTAWFLARTVHMDKMGSPPILRNSTFMHSCFSWTDTSAQCTSEGGPGSFDLWKKQKG